MQPAVIPHVSSQAMDSIFLCISKHRTPVIVGWLVCLLIWESAAPFFGFFQSRARVRFWHGLKNMLVGLASAIIPALGFVSLLVWLSRWAEAHHFGLLNLTPLPVWLHAAGAVLLLDVWTYGWHRANHRMPFLWRFHRVHHADAQMDVTTASRFHIGEIAMSSALRIPLVLCVGFKMGELAAFETLMLLVVQFHHANIGLPAWLDRLLRIFIVTPAMHKVHHSDLQPETDSNYTALFSVWDRIFRSFKLRTDPAAIQFGLREFSEPSDQTFAGMMRMPFAGRASQPNNAKLR